MSIKLYRSDTTRQGPYYVIKLVSLIAANYC